MAAPSILRDEAPPLLHGHKARRMESTPRVGTKWLYERGGTVKPGEWKVPPGLGPSGFMSEAGL